MANNYLRRYLGGEHEAVWAELLALGPKVREEPYFEPALAVCRELTRRSRLNLTTLINRLSQLDHQFWHWGISPHLARVSANNHDQWREEAIWELPEHIGHINDSYADTAGALDRAEKNGIFVPLAVCTWMEDIGLVSLAGKHPTLCPFYEDREHPQIYADPLEIQPVVDMVADSLGDTSHGFYRLRIGFDDRYKSEMGIEIHIDQDAIYWIQYPDASIDTELKDVWFPTTFVGYLRKSFQWGGFPGWERYPNRPEKELAFLREGLLPI